MAASTDFPGFVAQFRNVRGVVVFDPSNPPDEATWSWLERNHRYRNVGIVPAVASEGTVPESETVVSLHYPTPEIRALIEEVSAEYPRWVVEGLFLASAYVAPMFVYPSGLGDIQPCSLWDLYPTIELTEEQLLRHLRILGYGTVDFHASMVESGYEAVCEGSIPAERERRRREVETDGTDRCWRLFDEDEGTPMDADRWVGGYFDGLSLLSESATSMLESNPDSAIVLGVVGGLLMDIES